MGRRAAHKSVTALTSTLVVAACSGGGGGIAYTSPPAPLAITTTSLPDAISGQAYSQTLKAKGGTPPYTWSLGEGSAPLPEGLTLSSDGLISDLPEPQQGGWAHFWVTFRVRDSKSNTATWYWGFFAENPRAINRSHSPVDGPLGIGAWHRGRTHCPPARL